MKNDVLERIKQDFATYSKGQKLIASFILENYDKAAYMTAAKMGALVGVSESTVVRFATQLGYAGYPEFQRSLQEVIRSKLTSVQRIQVTNSRIGDGDVLESVLSADAEKIRRTLESVDRRSFEQAVDKIVCA